MQSIIIKLKNMIGVLIAILIFSLPLSLSPEQHTFLSIFSFVVYNWLFTRIPLFATGLIGVVLTIILKIDTAESVFSSFGHPIIFLFLGGFVLAQAFTNVGLDRRIALYLLSRSFLKGSMHRLLFVLMGLTCVFSMWVSNTATTAMMLPLILGTLKSLKINDKKVISFILIAIAYSASLGGLATPIGSPPNIIAIGMLKELQQIDMSFLEWLMIGFPISVAFLLILYFIISVFILKNLKHFDNNFIKKEFKELGGIKKNEIYTFIIFFLTVVFWLMPSFLKLGGIESDFNLNSGAVAIFFASLLFILPFGSNQKILAMSEIKRIDWSSLLLFGCGLVFGKLLFKLGLAQMASEYLIFATTSFGPFVLFVTLIFFTIFSTELASNTASANILIPIIITLSVELNMDPKFTSVFIALACSLAFMLPVATPPNAIVYGSERVEKEDMIKLGFVFNLLFGFILCVLFYFTSLSY